MATYFGSKPVSDWTANGSAETGHDFINQINNQQTAIDTAKGKYQEQEGKVGNTEQTYNDLFNNRTGYGDFYDQAKGSEGVNEAKEQYQKSLNAVNATNTAMNNLPSSMNASSNVVLNSAQRNAALRNQMTKYQNTMDYWTRQNAGDQSMYQTALGAAQNKAGQQMAQQQADIAEARANYQSQMDQLNQLYAQVANEKAIMQQIYGKMYDDEYNHMQQQIQIWADNLQAETARYAQDQANYRARLSKEASDYATNVGKYLNSGYTWNGNEWVDGDKLYQDYMSGLNNATSNIGSTADTNTNQYMGSEQYWKDVGNGLKQFFTDPAEVIYQLLNPQSADASMIGKVGR